MPGNVTGQIQKRIHPREGMTQKEDVLVTAPLGDERNTIAKFKKEVPQQSSGPKSRGWQKLSSPTMFRRIVRIQKAMSVHLIYPIGASVPGPTVVEAQFAPFWDRAECAHQGGHYPLLRLMNADDTHIIRTVFLHF